MPARVEVLVEDPDWHSLGIEPLAQAAADATLAHLGLVPEGFEISVLACADARIAALNADFRGKPVPTNVLSWPSEERAAPVPGAMPDPPEGAPEHSCELGDIAIASGVCKTEAEARGIPLGDHVTHLTVHAILHLLGFDHDHDADATLMERIETEILASMGLPDPY